MAMLQNRTHPDKMPTARGQLRKGFEYLTLDPSPRLRRLREEQRTRLSNPNEVVMRAWLRVGVALKEALRTTRKDTNSPRP